MLLSTWKSGLGCFAQMIFFFFFQVANSSNMHCSLGLVLKRVS